jgi:hypothetical protein
MEGEFVLKYFLLRKAATRGSARGPVGVGAELK